MRMYCFEVNLIFTSVIVFVEMVFESRVRLDKQRHLQMVLSLRRDTASSCRTPQHNLGSWCSYLTKSGDIRCSVVQGLSLGGFFLALSTLLTMLWRVRVDCSIWPSIARLSAPDVTWSTSSGVAGVTYGRSVSCSCFSSRLQRPGIPHWPRPVRHSSIVCRCGSPSLPVQEYIVSAVLLLVAGFFIALV